MAHGTRSPAHGLRRRRPLYSLRRCRQCGCTENRACWTAQGRGCYWVSADLCSICAEIDQPLRGEPIDAPAHV